MSLNPSIAPARILFIDDEAPILKSLKRATRNLNAECLFVEDGKSALALLDESAFDIIVSDMRMPHMDGATLLAEVARRYPETVRLVLSGYSDDELIMSAINEGRIWGFIHKPWDDSQLLVTLQQAITSQQMMVERALLRRTVERFTREHKSGFVSFIGSSMPMQTIYNQIEHVAPSNASVFITGPSGTGKELAAEALHTLSGRKEKPFIALNCAAIPSDLMESEIFGHVKGAFSGAHTNRDGAATQANGGTLFLDELGEMDMGLQAKLLRFIQTGSFQKVGGSKLETVDIRFICATNRPPLDAIKAGLLREDLYYRLNVISIFLPPLSQRESDSLLLANNFLHKFAEQENKEFAGFSTEAAQMIKAYQWPGNVRQLQNCIHSIVVMSAGPMVTRSSLATALQLSPQSIEQLLATQLPSPSDSRSPGLGPSATPHSSNATTANVTDNSQLKPLAEIEREYIEYAIEFCHGNVVKAASSLAVSPSTLYRKIQNWETASKAG